MSQLTNRRYRHTSNQSCTIHKCKRNHTSIPRTEGQTERGGFAPNCDEWTSAMDTMESTGQIRPFYHMQPSYHKCGRVLFCSFKLHSLCGTPLKSQIKSILSPVVVVVVVDCWQRSQRRGITISVGFRLDWDFDVYCIRVEAMSS